MTHDVMSFFYVGDKKLHNVGPKFLKIPVKLMEKSGNLRIYNPYKPCLKSLSLYLTNHVFLSLIFSEMNCSCIQMRSIFLIWCCSQPQQLSDNFEKIQQFRKIWQKVDALVIPKNLFTGCKREYCLESGITTTENISTNKFRFKVKNDCYLYGLGLLTGSPSIDGADVEETFVIRLREICGQLKEKIFSNAYVIKLNQDLRIYDSFFPKCLLVKNVCYELDIEFECKRERFINTNMTSERFNVINSCNIKNTRPERLLASSGQSQESNRNVRTATTSREDNLRNRVQLVIRLKKRLMGGNFVAHFIYKDL
jgi:hypothetical protein